MATPNLPDAPHYFSGGNTASGFVSYYDHMFRDLDRLYIIKGAPGTGKSKLMRDIANEACNRNYTIEYYHCASDPDSLDGIIIRDISIGVLDGTAPHVGETTKHTDKYGARESIAFSLIQIYIAAPVWVFVLEIIISCPAIIESAQ